MPGKITSVKSAKTGAKSSRAARTAKSTKADGTPKKRWSSADRAARGHSPRRSGGVPRSTRGDGGATRETGGYEPRTRPASAERRDAPSTSRRDASGFRRDVPVDERAPAPYSDRTSFDRKNRSYADRSTDRREAPARSDRLERTERPDRNDRNDRNDRPWGNRSERPTTQRSYGDRPDRSSSNRPARSFDNDRPTRSYDNRTDRSSSDRPARSFDNNRPERSSNDRPARTYDNDRPQRSYDNNRPEPTMNDRPARSYENNRPERTNDRPARSYDSRPERTTNDRPARSYGNRSDSRPARRTSDRPQRASRYEDFTPRASAVVARQERPVREEPLAPAITPVHAADFAALGLPPSLVATLTAQGITAPFPIQAATIPDALNGRDILGRGQTGSGKTLAFGLPMIATLAGSDSSTPRGLVLVPTRELAMQVVEALTPLVRTAKLSIILVAGGMSYTPQLRALQQGVDIIVATPGRLIDLMDQGAADLTRVEVTVLDEADHMADLGFMPAVTQILDTVPAGGQRLLFSATLDRAIDRLVKQYLESPLTHEVDSSQASVTTMVHRTLHIAPKDKTVLTAEIASREGRTLIFVRTQRGADRVAEQLRATGVMAGALHGGLAQGARTRVLEAFKNGEVPVLVATDVAARGIHVDDIGLVLQADPPGGPKEYLHRAGRTARAGGTGVVVSLVLPHQRREIASLTSQAGVHPEALPAIAGDPELVAATGAKAPTGAPILESDYQRLISPPVRKRFSGGGGDRSKGRGARSGGGKAWGKADAERRTSRSHHRAHSA